jgi:hypothetical protein
MLLAVIRGNLFGLQFGAADPVVTVTEGGPTAPDTSAQGTSSDSQMAASSQPATHSSTSSGNTFYERTVGLLQIVMALVALAMELGAGFAAHEAQRWSAVAEDMTALQHELDSVRAEMIDHASRRCALASEGAAFEHRFWRDYYRALLTSAFRGAIRKLSVIAVLSVALMHHNLHAQDCRNTVILVDLSRSVALQDHDSQTEFQKNLLGVSHVLASLPAGSRVAVFGITDDSFGSPYPLLQAELSTDEGYFKERLAKGRAQLVRVWQARSEKLQLMFHKTDILGALLLASEYFAHTTSRCQKQLVVFSDMRQATPILNLEGRQHIDTAQALRAIAAAGVYADLRGAEVYALGVDAADLTVEQWQELKAFWYTYFGNSGAKVITYSTFRDARH